MSGEQSRPDVHWWSNGEVGVPRALKEFNSLPKEMRGRLVAAMQRSVEGTSRSDDRTKLTADIWEWRAHKGNNHYRVLYCKWQGDFVALTAFYKNTQKTPKQLIERAEGRRASWVKAHPD